MRNRSSNSMRTRTHAVKKKTRAHDETWDVVIVGGGIVGLATAYRLRKVRRSWKILLLEKEREVALHQTGNNSGVVHSGVYYKPGSLKARLCVEGGKELLQFCRKEKIPFRVCGKVIVAVQEEELGRLDELYRRGKENGLKGIRLISREEITEVEPVAEGIRGLHVPSTAIVDYGRVSRRIAELLERDGVRIKYSEQVTSIQQVNGVNMVVVESTKARYSSKRVVTCAGLHSDRLASMTHPDARVKIIPFRGEYYRVRGGRQELVRGLVYPVPDPRFPFLGVHLTRKIDGGLEVGPNAVLAFQREGYRKSDVSLKDMWETLSWPGFRVMARKYWKTGLGEFYRSFSKAAFVRALQRLVPEIRLEDLAPGGAGVRAQACGIDGGLIDDFLFVGDGRILHVCNAPSPAVTASLAIGRFIVDRLLRKS